MQVATSDSFVLVDIQIFTFSQKASANFQLIVRLLQGVVFLAVVAGVSVAVVLTRLTIGDVFASALAIIPTGWGLLSVSKILLIYVYAFTTQNIHSVDRFQHTIGLRVHIWLQYIQHDYQITNAQALISRFFSV